MTKDIEKAHKLLALANRGVGGERTNALKILNRHIATHQLNKNDFLTDEEKIELKKNKEDKAVKDRELRYKIRQDAYLKFLEAEMQKIKLAEQLKEERKLRIKSICAMLWNIILWSGVILAFFYACESKAQDTTIFNHRYSIEFDSVYVVVDTLTETSYVYNHYATPVRYSINKSNPRPIADTCLIVHYNHFTITVTGTRRRKNFRKEYRL